MLLPTRTIRDSVYAALASCRRCIVRHAYGSFVWRLKHFFVVLFLLTLPLFLLTRAPAPAYAVTSNTVNFQARLETGGGAIAPDGYYNVQFNLYTTSTAGTSLWTETRDYNGGSPDNRVRVANGYLTVNLGDITSFPSTIPWDQQLYLTMNIGGTGTTSAWDGEMSPRLRLTAVPYAFNAKTASQLITTASGISSTLSLQAPTVGDQNFIIPDQGAAGTYTLLTGAAASGSYIQLQGTSPGTQQTGNFNISGTGIAAIGLKTPTISLGTAGSATGSIVLYNQNNTNKVTIVSGEQSTDLTLTVPNAGASSDEVCLRTLANCLGSGGGGTGAANTSLSNLYQTNINTALNTTGGDLTLQTTTSGNIVLNPAGSINLSQNTTLAAGKTITITGSTTANRPASPNEGMLYYDTSTHQLLQYNGTKWVSDRSTATKIVAASDSSQTVKDSADYVATGANDQATIATAIAALPTSGGTVYLLPGTYTFGASLDITKENVTLAGDGAAAATINRAFDGTSLANGGIVKVDADSVTVTNLTLNGNSATYNNSYDNGIYKSASYGGLNVNHVKLLGNKGSAVYLDGDMNNYNTDSVIADNSITTSYAGALYIDQGFDIQVSNNNINLSGGGDAISIASSDRITINGNTIKNAANGIIVVDSSHINVNANTVYYNNDKGINLNGGNESITISANAVVSNLVGIGLSGSSSHTNTDVTISGNTITSNGYEGVLLNDAVQANVTGNILNDNTGTSDHSSIRVNGSVDSSITSNVITDTAGTGYAILLEWYNAVDTYVSNNTFSGTGAESINNVSSTTIFANQMRSSGGDFVTKNLNNSTTAFQIQNASGSSVFTVDTTNNQLVVGNGSAAGSISLSDGSSHNITIATGTQSGNYTLSLPTLTSNDTICLQSLGNCSSSVSSVSSIGALDGGTANANGASISGSTLYLQSASASYAGLVNTATQYFAGNKRFIGSISVYDTSTLAFQIINSDSEKTLGFDNTNATLTLGTVNPSGESAAYSGSLQFASGAYNAYTVSIAPAAGLTASRTITLPNASGTVCLDSGNCVSSLSGSFIVNSTSLQTANFNISGTGKAANLQATTAMTVGTTTGTGILTNNGATVNTTLALGNFSSGGSIGTAATTVDIYTSISVAQTTASQTLTIPSPTASTSYGRMLYLSNIGTASFTLLGTPLKPGATATLVWNNTNGGASWQYAGSDGNSILNQTSSTQTAGFTINGVGTAATFVGTTSLQAPLLDTTSAIALNIGTTNATVINLNKNTTVAAGKSITIAGGITSTRPASPTAGTLYYDTTTNQLLQYNGTKWTSDRSTATKVVAASNSSQTVKDAADYLATGSGDQATINDALTAAAGGKVYLAEGTYTISAAISIPNNTTLAGAGSGTLITIPNAQNGTYNMITNTDATTGTGVVIRDLKIDGNRANQTSGVMKGIYLDHMGSSTPRTGATLTNLVITNVYGNISSAGVYLTASFGNTITNTTVSNVMSGSSIYFTGSTSNMVTSTALSGNFTGVWLDSSSNSNTIIGNTITGTTAVGIQVLNSSSNTITGNTVTILGSTAISISGASGSIITNNILSAASSAIYLFGSTNSTVNGNNAANNGGNTANNAIYLANSDNNAITNNTVTDTSATTTNYAINISDAASSKNYLADNMFTTTPGTATINDTGTGTVFANQSRTEGGGSLLNRTADSTTAFQVQNASGVALLTADTTNSKIVVTNLSVTGSISLPHGADFSTVGSSNDVDFGTGSLFRLTGASAQIITGVAGGTDGRQITLMNTASQAATLANNSGSSSAANVIITGTGSDLSIAAGASVTLVYDSVSAVWRVVGTISGTTSGGSYVSLQTGTLVADTGSLSLSGSGNAASFIATSSIQAPLLDTASSITLGIGTTNASFIMIGQWGVDTSINGQLSVAGYIQTGSGKIDTTNSSTDLLIGTDNAASIQLGQWNVPTTVSGQLTVNGGSLTLGTTFAGTTFITPEGSSVSTRINIPIYDVPNFGQILAFGVSSGSSTSSRALSIFDARTSAHQPSIAIFNPAETDAVGFSWDGSDSVALLKTLGADIGLNINGTTAASFTASQVNLNQNTAIASGKTLSVAGDTTISTTSATALKIQNASSVALLNVDTSSATITMGTGSNTVTFTGTGGLVATGTARHTKSIILSPEYAGAVLDAQSDSACSSAANGTMTAGYDSVNRTNYYNWTSTQTTSQCYDVVVQVPIPADFSGWYGGSITAKTSSTSNSSYGIAIVDSTGAYDANYGSSYASPGTLSTSWSNVATSVLSGTYTAGDYATFKIRMSAKNGANLQLGNITLYYYSSF